MQAEAMALASHETRFWRQADAAMPLEFSHALVALQGVNGLAVAFYGTLALVCGVGAYERRTRRGTKSGTSARVSFWIFAHVASCLVTQLSNLVMLHTKFDSRDALPQCHWHQKISATGYISAMAAQYMVLLVRSELTLDASNRWACLVFKLTRLMTVAGIPPMILVAMVTFNGAVFYAHTCTQELVLWLAWLSVVSGFGLSACFLLMFILPVYRHVKARDTDDAESQVAARRLLATARHNLRLSCVQIASSFVFQLLGAVLQSVLRDDDGRPGNSYLRLVNYTGYICDLLVNSVALLLLSSAWQPGVLARLLGTGKSALAYATGQREAAGAGKAVWSAAGASMRSTAPRLSTQATSAVAPDDCR